MSNLGLVLSASTLVFFLYLLCFNDKFRRELGRSAWKWKLLILGPFAVYGLLWAFFGTSNANHMMPAILVGALQVVMMMFMMVIQWVAMMWIMARPRIDWYMPGETMDNLTWDDYVGNDEIRERVKDLMDFIRDPRKYTKHGAKIPKGILMLGPPGVGKTYLARIIANMAGIPIAICESSSMQSPFMAVGALMVKSLYKKLNKLAKSYGAAIVFFDEIDAIGMSRNGPNGGGGMGMSFFGGGMGGSGILNALLGCMDGINSTEGFFKRLARRYNLVDKKKVPARPNVITIGATNAPLQALDAALVREGRFDWKIYVKAAGEAGLREQIKYFLRKRPVAEDVDVERLISDFREETPVAVDAVFNSAIIRALREGRDKMTYRDIVLSLWDRNFGLPSPINLGEMDSKRVAYHEGGHAVAATLWPMTGWRCWGATIVPRGDALGMVMSKPMEEVHTSTVEDLSRRLVLCLASRAVEENILGIKMNGFSGDLQSATAIAVAMISQFGMGEKMISFAALGQQTAPQVVEEAELIVLAHYELAKQLMRDNHDAVVAIAEKLLELKDQDGVQVQDIVKAAAKSENPEAMVLHEMAAKYMEDIKKARRAKKVREAREMQPVGGGARAIAPKRMPITARESSCR
jgi:cell division protease FtsH